MGDLPQSKFPRSNIYSEHLSHLLLERAQLEGSIDLFRHKAHGGTVLFTRQLALQRQLDEVLLPSIEALSPRYVARPRPLHGHVGRRVEAELFERLTIRLLREMDWFIIFGCQEQD